MNVMTQVVGSLRQSFVDAADALGNSAFSDLAGDMIELSEHLRALEELGDGLEQAVDDPDANSGLREVVNSLTSAAGGAGVSLFIVGAGSAAVGAVAANGIAVAIAGFVAGEAVGGLLKWLEEAGITIVGHDISVAGFPGQHHFIGTITADVWHMDDGRPSTAFEGRLGLDSVDYGQLSNGVVVEHMGDATVVHRVSAADQLNGIEIVRGTTFNDSFDFGEPANTANATRMEFHGGGGDDIFYLGGAGGVVDGGHGLDTLAFSNDQLERTVVDLRDGFAQLGSRGGLSPFFAVSSVERVIGSRGADLIKGDDNDNYLFGGEGDDEIHLGGGANEAFGGAGDDKFFVTDGFDQINGGEGVDEVHYLGAQKSIFKVGAGIISRSDHKTASPSMIASEVEFLKTGGNNSVTVIEDNISTVLRVDGGGSGVIVFSELGSGVEVTGSLITVSSSTFTAENFTTVVGSQFADFLDFEASRSDMVFYTSGGSDTIVAGSGNDRIVLGSFFDSSLGYFGGSSGAAGGRYEGGEGNDTYVFNARRLVLDEMPGGGINHEHNTLIMKNSTFSLEDDIWFDTPVISDLEGANRLVFSVGNGVSIEYYDAWSGQVRSGSAYLSSAIESGDTLSLVDPLDESESKVSFELIDNVYSKVLHSSDFRGDHYEIMRTDGSRDYTFIDGLQVINTVNAAFKGGDLYLWTESSYNDWSGRSISGPETVSSPIAILENYSNGFYDFLIA